MKESRWFPVASRRTLGTLLLAISFASWGQSVKQPVTLTYFRLGWFQPDEPQEANAWEQQFMQETGIQLRNLPVPETTLDQPIYRESFSRVVMVPTSWVWI